MHVHAPALVQRTHTAWVAIFAKAASAFLGAARLFAPFLPRSAKWRRGGIKWLPVHVPAVSPRELTGTNTSNVVRPPAARGGLQILGMGDDAQTQCIDKLVDVPVVQVAEDTVEIPRLADRGEIVGIPEIQTLRGTQTSSDESSEGSLCSIPQIKVNTSR